MASSEESRSCSARREIWIRSRAELRAGSCIWEEDDACGRGEAGAGCGRRAEEGPAKAEGRGATRGCCRGGWKAKEGVSEWEGGEWSRSVEE